MKYNEKYDRWITKGGLVYRYSKRQDKLVLCKLSSIKGYLLVKVSKPKMGKLSVHRLVYETFVGEIPQGYEIDHINTFKDDNRLENIRMVTHIENMNNPITLKHISEANKGNTNGKGVRSIFGRKFKEHYGITRSDDCKLYNHEYDWYRRHNNKCRWE